MYCICVKTRYVRYFKISRGVKGDSPFFVDCAFISGDILLLMLLFLGYSYSFFQILFLIIYDQKFLIKASLLITLQLGHELIYKGVYYIAFYYILNPCLRHFFFFFFTQNSVHLIYLLFGQVKLPIYLSKKKKVEQGRRRLFFYNIKN